MSGFIGQVQLPDWTKINTDFSPDRVNLLHNQSLASDTLPDQAQANLLISQNAGASASQDLTAERCARMRLGCRSVTRWLWRRRLHCRV